MSSSGKRERIPVFLSRAALIGAALTASPARAQTPAEFYAGKTIELYVGSSAGAGYDLYSRFLSRHWGKRIPGQPQIVVRNMEGAGSLRLASWLYNVAAKDATVVGSIVRGAAFEPLLSPTSAANFEPAKFGWIGSMNNEVSICAAWHASGVTRFEDVLARELVVGGNGPTSDTYQYAAVMNNVFGAKFRIVNGYPGGNEINLAMEKGEVFGRCGWSWSSHKFTHPTWYPQRKVHVLVQQALVKHPDLPDVPLASDFARTDEQRAILKLVFARQAMAWPFLTPPGVPADRLAALRRAFDETVADPEFLAEAGKGGYEIRPVKGADIEAIVAEAYRLPAAVVAATAAALK